MKDFFSVVSMHTILKCSTSTMHKNNLSSHRLLRVLLILNFVLDYGRSYVDLFNELLVLEIADPKFIFSINCKIH